jgi:hypothetical protein
VSSAIVSRKSSSMCTTCKRTIPHLMGIDHERLTFGMQGRRYRD